MTTTFIDTNKLPRVAGFEGEFTEILNGPLVGAKNVVGTLRWLQPGENFDAAPNGKHQLLYLMEGSGVITLDGSAYEVKKGSGVYLGPKDGASIRASAEPLKMFHLVVPQIVAPQMAAPQMAAPQMAAPQMAAPETAAGDGSEDPGGNLKPSADPAGRPA